MPSDGAYHVVGHTFVGHLKVGGQEFFNQSMREGQHFLLEKYQNFPALPQEKTYLPLVIVLYLMRNCHENLHGRQRLELEIEVLNQNHRQIVYQRKTARMFAFLCFALILFLPGVVWQFSRLLYKISLQ